MADLRPGDPRHGTPNGYVNHGCHCDRCRAAWRTYQPAIDAKVRYRRRHGQVERKRGRTHGIRATYARGCRCPDCREAERVYRAAYRARVSPSR